MADDSFTKDLSSVCYPPEEEEEGLLHPTTNMETTPIAAHKRVVSQSQPDLKIPSKVGVYQVYEENEELKRDNFILRGKLDNAIYREREMREQLPKEVQEVLDEFFSLKEFHSTAVGRLTRLEELELEVSKWEKRFETREQEFTRELREANIRIEKLTKECEMLRNSCQSDTDNDDWTLNSCADTDVEDLKLQLAAISKEKEQMVEKSTEKEHLIQQLQQEIQELSEKNKTFAMSAGEQELIVRIDDLEGQLKEKEDFYKGVIMEYMKKVKQLERRLIKGNQSEIESTANLTFDIEDKKKLHQSVDVLKTELSTLREQNKELRRQCAALTGGILDVSTNSCNDEVKSRMQQLLDETKDVEASVVQSSFLQKDEDAQKLNDALSSLKVLMDRMNDESTVEKDVPLERGDVQAMDISSFSAAPGIDLNAIEIGGALSCALQQSFNAVTDISDVRIKLGAFRDLLNSMFARLQGSASLFEEIIEYLADGSSESKAIADRIRSMKLEWSTYFKDVGDVKSAVDVAEQSFAGLQTQLSMLEHSLNETSFKLDISRRLTFARLNDTKQTLDVNAHLQMSLAEFPQISELEKKVAETTTRYEESQQRVNLLLNELSSTQKEKSAIAEELNSMKEIVEVTRKHLSDVQLANSDLQSMNDELNAWRDERVQEEKSTSDQIKNLMDDKERLLRDLYHLKTEKEELSESIQMKEVTMEHLQGCLQSAVAEKENICSRMDKLSTDLKEAISDVDSYRNDLLKKEESYKVLKSDYSTVKTQADEYAAQSAQFRTSFEALQKEMERQKRSYDADLAEAKTNQEALTDLVKELVAKVSQFESNNTTLGHVDATFQPKPSDYQISGPPTLLTMKDRSCQTNSEMDICHVIGLYGQLASAVRSSLGLQSRQYVNSMETDINDVAEDCNTLIGQISQENERRSILVEQLAKNNDKLESLELFDGKASNFSDVEQSALQRDSQKTVYNSPMRQLFYVLTTSSSDLVQKLKVLHKLFKSDERSEKVEKVLLEAKELRNHLYKQFVICGKEKENELSCLSIEDVRKMLSMSEERNSMLYDALVCSKRKLEELEQSGPKDNAVFVEKIARELRNIEKVMDKAKKTTTMHVPPKNTNAMRTFGNNVQK